MRRKKNREARKRQGKGSQKEETKAGCGGTCM
jgi:hypothetical protein